MKRIGPAKKVTKDLMKKEIRETIIALKNFREKHNVDGKSDDGRS